MQLITILEYNEDAVNTFVSTKSNIIISVSSDKSITIFNYYYKIIQKIKEAHNGVIFDIVLKDDNNFATCSSDRSIKTWVKSINNNYILNKSINNKHDDDIHKIEYLDDYTIISASRDSKIKIWNLVDNQYKCNITLDHELPVFSLFYIKEENILISTGLYNSFFWILNNIYNEMNPFRIWISAVCHGKNALKRLDKDRVVFGGHFEIQIVSLKEKQKIKEIQLPFLVWAICVIENKKVFICGGCSNNIAIFSMDNYDNSRIIENCHNGKIRGISLLNNGKIISGSEDKRTKIGKII